MRLGERAKDRIDLRGGGATGSLVGVKFISHAHIRG
jgi:hypothetical protein